MCCLRILCVCVRVRACLCMFILYVFVYHHLERSCQLLELFGALLDRQTNNQTDKQKDRWTDGQIRTSTDTYEYVMSHTECIQNKSCPLHRSLHLVCSINPVSSVGKTENQNQIADPISKLKLKICKSHYSW